MSSSKLKPLPPEHDLETRRVLKQLARANRALAELKGFSSTIPNKNILINAITINEAKDSSEIEQILTTHDELFKAISKDNYDNPAAKEVANYRKALWHGYRLVRDEQILTTNMIVEIQGLVIKNRAGIRKLPGTVLQNDLTGEVIYTPPDNEQEIRALLSNLEEYMNNDFDTIDPLIKLGVIHYQFEAIHPFYDGNGRTGRIINVLYLVLKNLLDAPILYLSRHIIRTKSAYYKLLQKVTTDSSWEEWILYILEGIEQTAEETLLLAKEIFETLELTSAEIKESLPSIYSRELLDLLFFEFYTKIAFIKDGLGVTRKTASNYLSTLEQAGFLSSQKLGRETIYRNERLFEIVKGFGTR